MQRLCSTFVLLIFLFSFILALQDPDPCQGASYCEVTFHKLTILHIMFTGAQGLPVSPFAASFGKRRPYSAASTKKCRRPRASRTLSKVNLCLCLKKLRLRNLRDPEPQEYFQKKLNNIGEGAELESRQRIIFF